jgi:hypothetical protein
MFLVGAVLVGGCHEEPTIVIRFEPTDAAVRPHVDAARSSTAVAAAPAAGLAVSPDLGSAPGAECKAASECVAEPVDCCDCAHGGALRAISKAAAVRAKPSRRTRCKDQVCAAMMSTDPSCARKPDCVDGRCVLVEPKPATRAR